MMKRHILLSLAALAAMGLQAREITSPLPQGTLLRAEAMERADNSLGVLDASRQLLFSDCLTPGEHAEAAYLEALGLLRAGDIDRGAGLMARFLRDNPASALRFEAREALAEAEIARGNWAAALNLYGEIPDGALTGQPAQTALFNRAYAMMMLGDYDGAARLFELVADPTSAMGNDALFYRGYIAYVNGEYDRAKRLFSGVDRTRMPGRAIDFYMMEMDFVGGKYEAAAKTASRLLKDPSLPAGLRPEINRVAGESLYNLGQRDDALAHLWEYAAEVTNPTPSAFYILGMSELDKRNWDNAVKLLQRAVTTDDAMAQSAWLGLGQAYHSRGDNDEALMAFEQAYKMGYDRDVQESAFYNYAVARMDGGRVPFGTSVGLLEQFVKQFPNSRYLPSVRRYIVEGYMTQNDYEAALRALDADRNLTPELQQARRHVLLVLGSRLYTAGDLAKARPYLEQAVAGTPVNSSDRQVMSQAQLWLGDCRYFQGDYDGAVKAFQAYLDGDTTGDAYNRALAEYQAGYACFSGGNYDKALRRFENAIDDSRALDPRVAADAHNRAGDCILYMPEQRRNLDEARRHYASAYDLHPASGDYAIYQTAITDGLRGDFPAKVAGLDMLINEFPASGLLPNALLERAETRLAQGNRADAIATYRRLVEKYPATAPGRNGYLQLALTYLNGGDHTSAIEAYKEVISNYPTSDEAHVAADDLKRLYAADGNLDEYADFINSIPEAPRFDAGEVPHLTFEAAENDYLTNGKTRRLAEFVERYPDANDVPKATYYLAESAWNSGNAARTAALCQAIIERFPHAETAEQAMLLKAEAENAQGKQSAALSTLRGLEARASTAEMLQAARMGIMRTADALGRHEDALAAADALMSTTAGGNGDSPGEITYIRAKSLDALGRHKEARKLWKSLAAYPDNLYGSMSAVSLGQSLLDSGDLAGAQKTIDALIDANPPHSYWLARGFIVYSDILRAQGKDFEAREYLRSLRTNYPGKEPDIIQMINQRLSK